MYVCVMQYIVCHVHTVHNVLYMYMYICLSAEFS